MVAAVWYFYGYFFPETFWKPSWFWTFWKIFQWLRSFIQLLRAWILRKVNDEILFFRILNFRRGQQFFDVFLVQKVLENQVF